MKTKATLLTGLLAVSLSAFGQVRTDMSVIRERSNSSAMDNESDYVSSNSYALGVGLGSTKVYGDLAYSNPQPAYIADLTKPLVGRIMMGLQVQVGDLSSRDPYSGLRSFNHYISVAQHLTVELGTFIGIFYPQYNDNLLTRVLGGFYAGTGIGFISNDIKRIADARFPNIYNGEIANNNPAILQSSVALYFPINVGFNYRVKEFWKFKGASFYGNFQYSYTMSDYIDGYKPPYRANKSNDVYTVMSLGFRFNLVNRPAYIPGE